MASFELNHLFKDLISKYSYILKVLEIGMSIYESGRGNTIQPIIPTCYIHSFAKIYWGSFHVPTCARH